MSQIQLKELYFGARARLSDSGIEIIDQGRAESPEGDESPASVRFREEENASPETLLTLAHVVCYLSALSSLLSRADLSFEELRATSLCTLSPREDEGGYFVKKIDLAVVSSGDSAEGTLHDLAEEAEKVCPISGALSGETPIEVRVSKE